MPGLKRWIQPCPVIDVSNELVIHSTLEINTLFGVLLSAWVLGAALRLSAEIAGR